MVQKASLSTENVERYCIEEVVLRAVRIQATLKSLVADQKAQGEKNVEQTSKLISQLDDLKRAAQIIAGSLETKEMTAVHAPLVLTDPVKKSGKYSIEKVTAKFANGVLTA